MCKQRKDASSAWKHNLSDTGTRRSFAALTLEDGSITTTSTPSSCSKFSLEQSLPERQVAKAFDCYFYVVHNYKIVGRYGADLIDALSHLGLLSRSSACHEEEDACSSSPPVSRSNEIICSFPLQSISSSSDSMREKKETLSSSTRRSSDNRALIPVINNRICHPFHLLSCLPLQEYILQRNKEKGLTKQCLFQSMQCCHWDNPRDLQRMQCIVQREHRILQPAIYSKSRIRCNSNAVLSLPVSGRHGKKDFSSRVRSKCFEFLNDLQHPDERSSNVHVVKDDE